MNESKTAAAPVPPEDDFKIACDFCASEVDYEPWHGSGLLNGTVSRHIHACDECRGKLPVPPTGGQVEALAEVMDMGNGLQAEVAKWRSLAENQQGIMEVMSKRGVRVDKERDALKAELERQKGLIDSFWRPECDRTRLERDTLQSEVDQLSNAKGDPVGSFDKHMEYMHANIRLQSELRETKEALTKAQEFIGLDRETWYGETPDGDSALLIRADVLVAMRVELEKLCKHPSMSFHQLALIEGILARQSAPAAKCKTCDDKKSVCVDWDAGAWSDCPDCAPTTKAR